MTKRLHRWLRFLSGHSLHQVFTPNGMAVDTYLRREDLEREMLTGLRTPGMQVVVCGPAGSGKSNLAHAVLRRAKMKCIISCCTETTTIKGLIAHAFAQLPATALYPSTQRLGELLALADIVWVVDDFHRVAERERQKMLRVIKVFSDLSGARKSPRLLLLGTGIAALELFYYDANMANRLVEVNTSCMSRAEMAGILNKCERLLNISFPVSLHRALVRYANSMPGILHELGFLLCMSKAVWKKKRRTVWFDERDLIEMVDSWLSMHKFFGEMITEALKLPDCTHVYRLLELLAGTGQNGLTLDDILSHPGFLDTQPAQLQYCLYMVSRMGPQPLLRQCPYSDAWAFADPYMKAYAIMYFDRKDLPALVPH